MDSFDDLVKLQGKIKKLDYNREVTRTEVVVNTFYKLFSELNNHD